MAAAIFFRKVDWLEAGLILFNPAEIALWVQILWAYNKLYVSLFCFQFSTR